MSRPPDRIEKGADSYTDAPDNLLHRKTAYPRVYRCDSRAATFGPLRLLHDNGLKARVLEKARREVRRHPQTVSLWAFRLSQHVNRGTFGYREAWDVLEAAAVDGGARASRVRRVLYRSFADSMTHESEPLPLTVLAGGVH